MQKTCTKCKVLKRTTEFVDDKGIERKICRHCSVVRRLWYEENQVRLNRYKRRRFKDLMKKKRRPKCTKCGKYPRYPDRKLCWRCSQGRRSRAS